MTNLRLGLLLFLTPLIWWAWRRWQLITLHWPKGFHQKQIAKFGLLYMKTHGIDCDIGDTLIDVWIPGRQFPGRVNTFLLAFRDSREVTGELMFRDLARAAFETGRGPLILVSTSRITRHFTVNAEINNFDVIHLNDLKSFAKALRALKSREDLLYKGPGERIKAALQAGRLSQTG